jgi:hypothetical protein
MNPFVKRTREGVRVESDRPIQSRPLGLDPSFYDLIHRPQSSDRDVTPQKRPRPHHIPTDHLRIYGHDQFTRLMTL